MDDNIKMQAIDIYIDTMIKLYTYFDYIKFNMFVAFGCTFYKYKHYYLPDMIPLRQDIIKPKIKNGIVRSILGDKCVLLLSFINYLMY